MGRAREHMEQVEQMVAQRAGLSLRPSEREALGKIVQARMQALRMGLEPYRRLLGSGQEAGEAEWAHIFARLTNNESYFFRDAGQLALLESHILPALIERNHASRTLRLWSAGCSTGEEPYSLAMMLDEILPRGQSWDVQIVGTDLSEDALERARRATYGPWSFRATSPARRQRYFQPGHRGASGTREGTHEGGGFRVEPRIQRLVALRAGNLVGDAFPSRASGLLEMDLIVCRNVFIYFGREAIAGVVEKFSRTLRPGGYLLTGHAELHDVPLHGLQPRAFPQTIIYQRPPSVPIPPAPLPPAPLPPAPLPPAPLSPARPVPAPAPPPITAPASTCAPASAVEIAQPELEAADGAEALLRMARLEADAGRYRAARELCERAMSCDALSPAPHHLLARVAWEEGDHERAKGLLKKVIYLAPSLPWPYIELEAIYRREGDLSRARTMRRAALQVLEELPPGAPVPDAEPAHAVVPEALPGQGQVSCGQLIEHLKALG